MIILLPPSETKRDGGVPGSSLDHSVLSFPELAAPRVAVLGALQQLSRNLRASTGLLSAGPRQRADMERNRTILASATMPAIDRYTGVLYDGLDSASLDGAARAWLDAHVVVHSALFGLVRASDPIPAYRLSHNSKLPGVRLGITWRGPISAVLRAIPELTLDLRSEAYASLGPAPSRPGCVYLRIVTESPGGQKKALTHFNKKGKGEFVRALAEAGIDHPDVESLLAWAGQNGIQLARGAPGELDLTV